MTDMLKTIVPKSDQANYDDFIGGVIKTIKVTKVIGTEGDQPISIHYENDNGKPYKPCKSMRRALVALWGANGQDYIGKSMTLYGDPEVMFGGVKVGGIRISHVSGITEPHVLALTNKKGSRKPFTVKPLVAATSGLTAQEIAQLKTAGQTAASGGMDALKAWWGSIGAPSQKTLGVAFLEEMKGIASGGANGPNDE